MQAHVCRMVLEKICHIHISRAIATYNYTRYMRYITSTGYQCALQKRSYRRSGILIISKTMIQHKRKWAKCAFESHLHVRVDVGNVRNARKICFPFELCVRAACYLDTAIAKRPEEGGGGSWAHQRKVFTAFSPCNWSSRVVCFVVERFSHVVTCAICSSGSFPARALFLFSTLYGFRALDYVLGPRSIGE